MSETAGGEAADELRRSRARERRQFGIVRLSAVALVLVGLLLGLEREHAYRQRVQAEISVQAEILAASVTAALAFDDRQAVLGYLDALRLNPQIARAVVFDAEGQAISLHGAPVAAAPETAYTRFVDRRVEVTRPVQEGDTRLGWVRVVTAPEPWTSLAGRNSGVTLMTLMAVLLLWLAGRTADQLNRRADQLAEANDMLREQMAQRAKAEEALRQSQKMEALGQLTGGVAHDFNNLLTVIMGGLETIGRQMAKLPPTPEIPRMTRARDMALHGAERAATLTQRLLAFSRRQPLQPQSLDINKLVRGMGDLLRRTLGETVMLETVLSGGIWRTQADAAQLENAILNLAVNARDAMPDGGRLTIETGNAALDEAYAQTVPEGLAPGQYVLIAVTDTGVGMDPQILGQALEPFFTTKEVGKGTGLGLSQVYGFVRQSHGHVAIYSEPGDGTTVKIYLPRHHGEEETAIAAAAVDVTLLTGDETVLLVEDHEDLRSYSAGILRELGYRVTEARDGEQALALVNGGLAPQLLFTDVVLPGSHNGRQLADAVGALRPGIRVLFTTGYTRNAIVHNGRLDPGVHLISKPFSFEQLAQKVRQVLDEPALPAS